MTILTEINFELQESLKKCSKKKVKNCKRETRVIHKMEKTGFLVPITKSFHTFEGKNTYLIQQNQRSIEVFARDESPPYCSNFEQSVKGGFQQDFRLLRFSFQRIAREILLFCSNPRHKKWRTIDCLWSILASHVSLLHSSSINRAYFGNLAICGSVWACPVCSTKISERRKVEIVHASNLHKAATGGLYMVTMTWAHSRHDDLQIMVKTSRDVLAQLRKQRPYIKNLKAIDYVGMIRAFEVTHGDKNGWHPHFHELWFLKRKLTDKQLFDWKRILFEQWSKQCVHAGLGKPNRKFGITIIEAESAAEYLIKFGRLSRWDVGSELTKHQQKHGRNGSRSPWDFLRLYADGERRFSYLFMEYLNAFYGARQVYWSNGLKKVFGIKELNDEKIGVVQEEDTYEMCKITKEDWKKVLAQSYEARSLILKLAETGKAEAVQSFIASL